MDGKELNMTTANIRAEYLKKKVLSESRSQYLLYTGTFLTWSLCVMLYAGLTVVPS
jgi:hypothetical protein